MRHSSGVHRTSVLFHKTAVMADPRTDFILPYGQLRMTDTALVGGKNASLGEMIARLEPEGIRVPEGFAVTAGAYRHFLEANGLEAALGRILDGLDREALSNLHETGAACRALLAGATLPPDLRQAVLEAYHGLDAGGELSVAVRSSATAEDLPTASFAGQHDSFLHITGGEALLEAIQRCYVSLFNDRAIKYRMDNGFEHLQVALSAGVQRMVRSDLGAAGVAFSIDPETGFDQAIYLTAAWGLGENVVQGAVSPDEFYLWKPALAAGHRSIITRHLGAKEHKMVYAEAGDHPLVNVETSAYERHHYALSDAQAELLGLWCLIIERHYGMPMDIEWALDGASGELFIVQARPETVHGQQKTLSIKEYRLQSKVEPICAGKAVGRSIVSGPARIIRSLADAPRVQQGDIIVADITNPDWNALLRKAVSIVTNKGGRTSHASIVARELGIHAVVGTQDATTRLRDGQIITVSCIEGDVGKVYDGALEWEEQELHLEEGLPTRTRPMLILADPDMAFRLAAWPQAGVGLLRMEFIISNTIRIHPMALVRYDSLPDGHERRAIAAMTRLHRDKKAYFVEKLSEAVAMVAAAFHPHEVIVRMSDFKTNEYAQLIGGRHFEPEEENPMLGFRGASRYDHPRYREGFGLECEAIRVVRDEIGLTNVKVMIPFCRTVEEARRVLEVMKDYGLARGRNGLEVYVMVEIPSNVIRAGEFAEIFDGFSIGSNDLTQLTLGLDRDSAIVSDLFDERDPAVMSLLRQAIRTAREKGIPIGLCGQAPSDHPEFARFLVEEGITSISFTPDALLTGIAHIRAAEAG
jgi:pyruvate, water dikinase